MMITAKEEDVSPDDAGSSDQTLTERYFAAISLVESSPGQCISLLDAIQKDIDALSLFSKNETMEDISTKSIPFLALEHFMAMALVNLPAGPGAMKKRKSNILQSLTLWGQFLERLEVLEVLTKEETKEYHDLLDEQQQHYRNDGDDNDRSNQVPLSATPNRDVKIARFKARQQRQKEIEQLKALRERRNRCGIAEEDEMDGYDQDSLDRSLAMAELYIHKGDALENWSQSMRELPMIEMMVKMEADRQHMDRHAGNPSDSSSNHPDRPPPPSGKGLQVTHITKDSTTGQLQFKRDEIRSKVFRPGWSQPTMTLEELGEREYQQAMEREERQKQAEANKKNEPRRYEDLVRDGMEDNAELVEASAKLDREWDDWKDANPRGSGNKMANRGDKNF
ncbi:TAP42-like family protein [Nitzschia inconspicua]|uniref:TAP42-like family protein n=1 Tax=Nitzschia inconspicua TaxID=303405 RepID=A0A9K3PY44_9STRA|nr:TAP42-like family protein [Nitzschia inconspicua]